MIHGGAGTDRVILPGSRSDYTRSTTPEGRIAMSAGWRIVLLTEVEEVSFEDTPDEVITLP